MTKPAWARAAATSAAAGAGRADVATRRAQAGGAARVRRDAARITGGAGAGCATATRALAAAALVFGDIMTVVTNAATPALLLLCVVTHQDMVVALPDFAEYSLSLAQHPLVIFCSDAVGSTSWKAITTHKSSPSSARQQRLVIVAEYSNVTLYGTTK